MSGKGAILIIDDLKSIRMMIGAAIMSLGFDLLEAGNGQEGLDQVRALQARSGHLLLIITDLNMPTMDGIDFIRSFRTFDKTTPIVMLTTESQPEKRLEGKEAGANAWVVKPVKPEQIIEIVRKMTKT